MPFKESGSGGWGSGLGWGGQKRGVGWRSRAPPSPPSAPAPPQGWWGWGTLPCYWGSPPGKALAAWGCQNWGVGHWVGVVVVGVVASTGTVVSWLNTTVQCACRGLECAPPPLIGVHNHYYQKSSSTSGYEKSSRHKIIYCENVSIKFFLYYREVKVK